MGPIRPTRPLGPADTKARFRAGPCHRGGLRFQRTSDTGLRAPGTGFPLVPPIPVNRCSELDVGVGHDQVTVARALNQAGSISVCPPFGSNDKRGRPMSYQVGVDLGATFTAVAMGGVTV